MTGAADAADGGAVDGAADGAGGPFEGFTTGGAATTLPAQFFVDVLPQIEDEAELRVTLYALYAIARRKGQLRAVSAHELASEAPLARCFERLGGVEAVAAAIAAGLVQAAARGTLLACPLDDGDTLYFVNNDGGRRNLARVRSGALEVPGAAPVTSPVTAQPARPAQVYEQEIGTLTPSVAEALAEAGARFPEQWIVDALREAAISNARSWRYAAAILERWDSEGRDGAGGGTGDSEGSSDASAQRNPRTAARGDDPYARVVRRSWP